MFIKLRKKVMNSILITTIIFISIMSIVSFFIIRRSLYDNFVYSAKENINQNINNSSFIIEAAKNSTIQISQNKEIINSITSDKFNTSITPILNTLKNTSFGIIGVTLYTDNYTYSTSSISAYPTLEEIKSNTKLFNFINSSDFIFTSIRTDTIANIYNNVRYNPDYGIISHIIKVYNEEKNINGYLFVDINPAYIYKNYFNYDKYPNIKETKTFIISQDGKYLKSEFNNDNTSTYLDEVENEQIKRTHDRKYLIITHSYISNTQVITLVPLKSYYINLLWIFVCIVLTSFVLIMVSYFIAKRLTNNIIHSLSHLHEKMQNTKIDTSD